MTMADVGLVVLSGVVGATLGAIGGAYGATSALREKFDSYKGTTDLRLTRVETRVGITKDGALTGNGLISRVHDLEAQGG